MTRRVATMAATARATLSPNTARQDQTSSRTPEASRPRIALAPATPAQAPTARDRCSRGKVLVIVDRVAGMTSAAPTPEQAAHRDQPAGVGDGHRGDRPGAEDGEAGQQGPAPAVPVADRAAQQQQRGEDQGVGVDHPGQLGLGGVGVLGRSRGSRR